MSDKQKREAQELLARRFPGSKVDVMDDNAYAGWIRVSHIKHFFGIHTYIPTERWDKETDSVRYVGECCWLCDARR